MGTRVAALVGGVVQRHDARLVVCRGRARDGALPEALTLRIIVVTIATYGLLVGGQVYRY
ncbi:MAG TPA: hypothetical protein VG455_05875 [Acidimicrobiales bacterium]|nr:hypothetical protein [Acidimicrobiales bacterium]